MVDYYSKIDYLGEASKPKSEAPIFQCKVNILKLRPKKGCLTDSLEIFLVNKLSPRIIW